MVSNPNQPKDAYDGMATIERTEAMQVEALHKLRVIIRAIQNHSLLIEHQYGVSSTQLWVMWELSDVPGMRVGEIANKLGIHQTTASNLLDGLVKKELVIKWRDNFDQRVVKLKLSEQGATIMSRVPRPTRGLLRDALGSLETGQLCSLNVGLQALVNVIDLGEESNRLQPLPFTL